MNKPALSRTDARMLLHLVQQGHLDAAIEAGLMQWPAHSGDDGLDNSERALLMATCHRLRTAWAARERFRARKARLEQREHERRMRRAAATVQPASPSSPPALPAAASTILARARERAGLGSQ